jgi:2-hydroxychromene-2-carboxylate isomerase
MGKTPNSKTVEFLFDFGSPATYLAHKRIPEIAERTGAAFDYQPFLLGGVFKATGNASPVTVAAKGRWMMADLARWAARHGTPFRMNPFFPINTLTLMRAAAGLKGQPGFERFVDAVFDAIWKDGENMNDEAVVAEVLYAAGLDGKAILETANSDEAKARLRTDTERAVERGVFGAPTFFVGDEMHFGQDRLDFVEDAIAA